jgi:isoleucyl-tRNA synthetase
VHLSRWPEADAAHVDAKLSETIRTVRALVSLGLQVRTQAKLKVRQTLAVAKVILADASAADGLGAHLDMVKDELNVLAVEVVSSRDGGAEAYVTTQVKPNFRTLGQKGMGKQAQELKKSMAAMRPEDAQKLVAELLASGKATALGVDVEREDVEVAFEAKEGYAAAGDRVGVVVLDTRLTPELLELGFVRELLNRIQTARKEMQLEFTDRIALTIDGDERTARIVKTHAATIQSECLAVSLDVGASADARDVDVEGATVRLGIVKAARA